MQEKPTRPLVIAHRGASGYRPEHTLAAYELAVAQGADYIEPDCVITKDGHLVARHENEISGTTNVADLPRFASRKKTKKIDGRDVTGWFVEDFTLAEIKTLRAKERLGSLRPQSAAFDGKFEVPTLDEVMRLARRKSAETGRTVGIYPETKHPTYFRSIGLPLETPLVALLKKHGYVGRGAPVFIQSFEVANLLLLRKMTDVPLVQLLDERGGPFDVEGRGQNRYADMAKPEGLAAIAAYAQGVGPAKGLLLPRDGSGSLTAPSSFVADAHRAGLLVHPWTFRSENAFLPAGLKRGDAKASDHTRRHGDFAAEYRRFLALGVDGLFSDYPDHAVAAARAAAA